MGKITLLLLLVIVIAVIGTATLAKTKKNVRKSSETCPRPPTDGSFHPDVKCEGWKKIGGFRCPCRCKKSPMSKTRAGWYCPRSKTTTTVATGLDDTSTQGQTSTVCATESATTSGSNFVSTTAAVIGSTTTDELTTESTTVAIQ